MMGVVSIVNTILTVGVVSLLGVGGTGEGKRYRRGEMLIDCGGTIFTELKLRMVRIWG